MAITTSNSTSVKPWRRFKILKSIDDNPKKRINFEQWKDENGVTQSLAIVKSYCTCNQNASTTLISFTFPDLAVQTEPDSTNMGGIKSRKL